MINEEESSADYIINILSNRYDEMAFDTVTEALNATLGQLAGSSGIVRDIVQRGVKDEWGLEKVMCVSLIATTAAVAFLREKTDTRSVTPSSN